MIQLQLKYLGKARFLALKTTIYNQDGIHFTCILSFLIVRSVQTGKVGGSGTDLEEFTKLKREDLMKKKKSLALMRGFIIVV